VSTLAKAALVGVGAFALERVSARSAVADGDFDPAAAPVLDELGQGQVCDAELAGGADSFGAAWSRDATALRAEHGTLLGDLPALRAACCAEWAKRWLDTLQKLHDLPGTEAGIRYNFGGVGGTPGAVTNVYTRPTALWAKYVVGRNGLGSAWLDLLDAYDYARSFWVSVGDVGQVYAHCREIGEATRALARELDLAASTELDPAFGDYVARAATAGARSLGNGLAWGIEELVSPVLGSAVGATIGAVTSAAAPYLVVGGVVYFAWRHR